MQWVIGKGDKVTLMNQPWIDGWENIVVRGEHGPQSKVVDMREEEGENWDINKLRLVLGEETARWVLEQVRAPRQQAMLGDRLIWKGAKSGKYMVKEGYRMLTQRQHREREPDPIWGIIWRAQQLLPKIKLFLWRAVQNGLPTAQEMHRRIARISPSCARCAQESEFTNHLLFFFAGLRAAWFVSGQNVRIEEFPLNFSTRNSSDKSKTEEVPGGSSARGDSYRWVLGHAEVGWDSLGEI